MTAQRAIVVAGGTGLVGREVVRLGLAAGHPVMALVRKPGALAAHAKDASFSEIVADFNALEALGDKLAAASPGAFVSTLGTTIRTAGSQEAFARVDRGYVLAFAKLGRAAGATRFGLVSAVDADPASRNFYLRTKGEAEAAVSGLGYSRVDIMRPSFLLGDRQERRVGETLGILATQALSPFMLAGWSRYKPIRVEAVAAALLAGAVSDREGVAVSHYNEMMLSRAS